MRTFRLRTLLFAVAVIAAVLGRWMNFRHRAYFHHQELGRILVSDLEFYLACTAAQGDCANRHEQACVAAQPLLRFIHHHLDMEEKYTNAFRRPWLPVARDPPVPALPSEEYQRAFRAAFLPGPPTGGFHSHTMFPHAPEVAVPTLSQ